MRILIRIKMKMKVKLMLMRMINVLDSAQMIQKIIFIRIKNQLIKVKKPRLIM